MSQEEQTVEKLYRSFAKGDYEGMKSCYSNQATFSDPAFPSLKGEEVWSMWEMLIKRATSIDIKFSDIQKQGGGVTAKWEAIYPFSKTGRQVHNKINAEFQFDSNGLIVSHKDTFDFWRWSGMALGPVGKLMGWSNWLRKKVQTEASKSLTSYMSKKSSDRTP